MLSQPKSNHSVWGSARTARVEAVHSISGCLRLVRRPMKRLMWGAAPRNRRAPVVTIAVAIAATALCGSANARVNAGSTERAKVWGIEVTGESLGLLDARTARAAREAGVNTLLLGTEADAEADRAHDENRASPWLLAGARAQRRRAARDPVHLPHGMVCSHLHIAGEDRGACRVQQRNVDRAESPTRRQLPFGLGNDTRRIACHRARQASRKAAQVGLGAADREGAERRLAAPGRVPRGPLAQARPDELPRLSPLVRPGRSPGSEAPRVRRGDSDEPAIVVAGVQGQRRRHRVRHLSRRHACRRSGDDEHGALGPGVRHDIRDRCGRRRRGREPLEARDTPARDVALSGVCTRGRRRPRGPRGSGRYVGADHTRFDLDERCDPDVVHRPLG